MSKNTRSSGKSPGILEWIERIGNQLPDPVLLFVIFAVVIIAISWLGALLGWSAVNPGDGSVVTAFSLLSREGIVKMFTEFSSNIKSFSALTDQMVVLLGLALLEGTGLAGALMRRFFVKMPDQICHSGAGIHRCQFICRLGCRLYAPPAPGCHPVPGHRKKSHRRNHRSLRFCGRRLRLQFFHQHRGGGGHGVYSAGSPDYQP